MYIKIENKFSINKASLMQDLDSSALYFFDMRVVIARIFFGKLTQNHNTLRCQ